MKEYHIQLVDSIEMHVRIDNNGDGGSITSTLHENLSDAESEADLESMKRWNSYADAIESIVLAHACAGIDINEPKYVEGISTAYEAYGFNEELQ